MDAAAVIEHPDGKYGQTSAWAPLRWSFLFLLSVQVVDVWTTHSILSQGGVERNPLSHFVLALWGVPGLAAVKVVLSAVSLAAAVILVRRGFSGFALRGLYVVNVVYGLTVVWNTYQTHGHAIRI